MTLGQRIQELRRQAGMSQEKLGEALGVSRQAVSKWESDGGVPELDTLIAMSRLFGVTLGQLLGVEEPKQNGGSQAEDSPKGGHSTLDEEQVEDILRRYVEATRKQAPPMYGRYGWKAPLIAVAGLAALTVLFGFKIGRMDSTISNINSKISYLESSLDNLNTQMANLENRVQDILAEQNNPLSSFDAAVTAFDPEAETVTLGLSATLKTYAPGTQLQFVLTWTKADGSAGQTVSDWADGPNFEIQTELPMSEQVDAALRLQDADGVIQEQALTDAIPGLSQESFRLSADSLSGLYSISVGSIATTTASDPAVRVFSHCPELFQPVSAELTVTLNGEVLEASPLTLTEEETGIWYGRDDQGTRSLRLSVGDELVFSLRMTDSLGREECVTEKLAAKENGFEETPAQAVDVW